MTYNVLYGGEGREDAVRAVVDAIQPDVAIFTEARATPSFESIVRVVGPHQVSSGDSRERVAIASRWPIARSTPCGPRWAPLKWISATAETPGGPITVFGVHLTPHLLWPFELWRWREVGSLLKCAAVESDPHLIAGDFNAISRGDEHRLHTAAPWVRAQMMLQGGVGPRRAIQRLTHAGYVDCYRARNPASDGFTVPAWDPQARIDYLFASRELEAALRSCGVADPIARPSERRRPGRSLFELLGRTPVRSLAGEASDHLPVWADFEVAL